MKAVSFPPIVDLNSEILILGSMPGLKSLEMQEYYAHKRNTFWRIIFALFETAYSDQYDQKVRLLKTSRIALWDVLYSCERDGSSDSSIMMEVPNDLGTLFKTFPKIHHVVFNGKGANDYYMKYHKGENHLKYLTLPSTSPANARLTYQQKLKQWSAVKELLK